MADESTQVEELEAPTLEPPTMPEPASPVPKTTDLAKLAAAGGGGTLLIVIGSAYAYFDSHFEASRERDSRIELRLTSFEADHKLEMQAFKHRVEMLERDTADGWDQSKQELWAARLAERLRSAQVNPDGRLNFKVPSVREVGRDR